MNAYNIQGKTIMKFNGNLYDIIEQARKSKASIISLEESISLRNILPFEHELWLGHYTREQVAYAKGLPSILIMNSLLLEPEMAKEAVKANYTTLKPVLSGNYYVYLSFSGKEKLREYMTLDEEKYKNFLTIAEKEEKAKRDKRTVIILPSINDFEISSTKNFNFLEQLIGKTNAEKYLKILEKRKIHSIIFNVVSPNYVNKQEKPLTTEVFLGSYLNGMHQFFGNSATLDEASRSFGVLN